jgi:hypothetical protein
MNESNQKSKVFKIVELVASCWFLERGNVFSKTH